MIEFSFMCKLFLKNGCYFDVLSVITIYKRSTSYKRSKLITLQ